MNNRGNQVPPDDENDVIAQLDFDHQRKPVTHAPPEDPYWKLKMISVVLVLLYLVNSGMAGGDKVILGIKQNVLLLIVIMISMTVHEFSHAWMANTFGDPTAKNLGRMSLNPMVHVDWIGLLLFFIGGYGWAKPVPVTPGNFRDLDRGMVMVSLAGPMSNIVLAFVGALLFKLLIPWAKPLEAASPLLNEIAFMFTIMFIVLNVGVALFNLIPVPPLDGSKILMYSLPQRNRDSLSAMERSGEIIIMFLVMSGVTTWMIRPLTNRIVDLMLHIVGAR